MSINIDQDIIQRGVVSAVRDLGHGEEPSATEVTVELEPTSAFREGESVLLIPVVGPFVDESSLPEGVSATFTRHCVECGGMIYVIAGSQQPHTHTLSRDAINHAVMESAEQLTAWLQTEGPNAGNIQTVVQVRDILRNAVRDLW